jgi:hypothetical protein
MSSQHDTENRPERDLERLASDTLNSSAKALSKAAKKRNRAYFKARANGEFLCPIDAKIKESGKDHPKKGPASFVLHLLIEADGYALTEFELMAYAGSSYIRSAVASLREFGWIITTSNRLTRDRYKRRIQKTVYSLDPTNNNITTN